MAPKQTDTGDNRVRVTTWVKGTKDEGEEEAQRQAAQAVNQNAPVALNPQQQAALGVLMNPNGATGAMIGPQAPGVGYQSYGPTLEAPDAVRHQIRKRDDFMSTVVAVAAEGLGGVNSGQTSSMAISEAGALLPPDQRLYSRLRNDPGVGGNNPGGSEIGGSGVA